MHRIDTSTAQTDKFGVGKNGFTNGDPGTGRRATDLNSDMWDAVQEEICNAIEKSGAALNKDEHDQLYNAIVKLITDRVPDALLRSNNLSDLLDKSIARANMGLKSAAVRDVQTSKDDVATGRVLVNGGTLTVDAEKVAIDKALQTPNIELKGGPAFVDFNSFDDSKDYNTRLYNDADNVLSVMGNAVDPQFRNLDGQFVGKGRAAAWGQESGNTTTAPFNASDIYAPAGDGWCPMIKGAAHKDLGYRSSVAFGFYIPKESDFNRPVIFCQNDDGTIAYWVFHNDGGRLGVNGRINYVSSNITRSVAFLDEVYSPSNPPPQQDLSPYAPTAWVNQRITETMTWANTDLRNDIYNWVRANFVSDIRLAGEIQVDIPWNGRLPVGYVCVGSTASNGNPDKLVGCALQKAVGVTWYTVQQA